MSKLAQKFILLFLFAGNVYFFSSSAQAQDATASGFGLTAIPPRLELEGKPGEVITKVLKIRNETNQEKILSSDIKDFVVLDEKGTPVRIENLPDGANKWALSPWLQISQTNFKLKPGETKAYTITAIIPEDATAGAHYAVVLHSISNETILGASGNAIQPEVGTLIYLRIPGDIKEEATALIDVPKFSEFGPINLKTTVLNKSDIHLAPQGQIEITDILGRKFALPIESSNIFPQTSRNFNTLLNKKWLFGRFRAELVATYGSQGQLLNPVIFFWVLPIRLILALITIFCLIIGIILIFQTPSGQKNRSASRS